MLVYGLRAPLADVQHLITVFEKNKHPTPNADYVTNYGLFMFSRFTQGMSLHSHGRLGDHFWSQVKRLAEHPVDLYRVDREHPYLTDEEGIAADLLRMYGDQKEDLAWWYVPAAVQH